jgi:ATP adenylyltransferase
MLTTIDHADMYLQSAGQGCRFCEIAQNERLVVESEHTTAFPSLGAFIEGWVLVAPRAHVVALSQLSGERWRDLDSVVDECVERIAGTYGPVVLFEHGAASAKRTAGCGVDHAHVHVVPWNGNLRNEIAAVPDLQHFTWHRAERRPAAAPGLDYIWLSDHTGTWITYAAELPSQVVRRAMSVALGLGWWEWKADLCVEAASATIERLHTPA